jgi:hypothetical protein
MLQARFGVPSCIERERLEFELLEVPRPRAVSGATALPGREEQAEWDRRERAASERLVDHGLEHGCSS